MRDCPHRGVCHYAPLALSISRIISATGHGRQCENTNAALLLMAIRTAPRYVSYNSIAACCRS